MAIQHYEGEIGIFDYDDEMFTLKKGNDSISEYDKKPDYDYLHFNRSYEGPISLPKGITSTRRMFAGCKTLDHCYFEDFDTSNVTDMSNMFHECYIPYNFSLGDKFDTLNVTNMSGMFSSSRISYRFSLGDKFDTSNVKDMKCMFEDCEMSKGFSLGDKFNTSNVTNMACMFEDVSLPEDFILGDKFDTSNVTNMAYMFKHCEIPHEFSLGDKFDTSNVKEMSEMFYNASLPVDFTLGDKFDTSNVKRMVCVFERCSFEGSQLPFGDKFYKSKTEYKRHMFKDVTIAGKPGKVHIDKDGRVDVFRPMSEVEIRFLKESKKADSKHDKGHGGLGE